MSRERLLYSALALLLAACAKAPLDGTSSFDASIPCEDHDHDGFGRGCEHGYDCNDEDPQSTTECRTCSRPERGCDCTPQEGPVSCFLDDKELGGGDVLCSEGTRVCREGKWSACEDVHQYIASPSPDTQSVIDPLAGNLKCSICDVKCFLVTDNLLADGGVAGGNVTFGPAGGITLLPADGGVGGGGDGGSSSSLTGCAGMYACCSTLSDTLKTACIAEAALGDNTACERDRFVYCPTGKITGPVQGCTVGTGADTDCDGIPNVVDFPGNPLSTTNNQTIFHQLDIGETGGNSINVSFKLRNADVYFLLDMTNTMKEERDNLIASLTAGNVVNCAQLNQCCARLVDPATKSSCLAELATYTNQPGKADDQDKCLTAESTYCAGNKPLDCTDNDNNGVPDNFLKTQGVVGATRCLVGSSWFGAGFSRELPVGYDPDGCSSSTCGTQYGDRDEQVFKHVIDVTPDYPKVLAALQSMYTDGNYEEPEAGMLAMYSVLTGNGHYFGINRPSIAPRVAATDCPPNSFGYPCFRQNAVPILVFFTDRPHHNGPPESTHCHGPDATTDGCPYSGLSKTMPTTTWTSGATESSSEKVARFVPLSAETFSTAYNAGDVRGKYLTLVGDTRFMAADYPTALVGCNAAPDGPDAVVRFTVSTPAGAMAPVPAIPINFHLTKDDAYTPNSGSYSKYGTWNSSRTNDPSPATEFGAVMTVYRGVPGAIASTQSLGDVQAYAIASGPDSTYLEYTGTTSGTHSGLGYLGGISGCSADGLTNQMLFTFRPSANSKIVVDSSGSAFPTVVSLHSGLPSALPKNPNMTDGTSVGIVNTNDTFATANAVPSGSTAIDGTYTTRSGDTASTSIHADYTTTIPRNITAVRTLASDTLTSVSSTSGLTVGMQLSNSTNWSGSPVSIVSISGSTIKLSALWLGVQPVPLTDPMPVPLTFLDSVVGCGVDPQGNDSVFKFNVATPRRVRIDTEGSTFDTVISLHDAPPPTVVTKNDVAGNGTAPGYSIGDAYNASYTLSDVNMGTTALADTYVYAQCGAGAASKDGLFTFTLSKPTHLGIDVTSASWDPIVGLFSAPPAASVVLNNAANNNDKLTAPSVVFDLGDVYGNVDTIVQNSDLTGMADDFQSAIVGCGAISGGRDQVFKMTPLNTTRVRLSASSSGSAWYPVIAVFDDPPPSSATVTTSATFDATTVTLPDSNCLVYSYHDPGSPATPAHTYAFCPTKRYADDAQNHCVSAGMAYLASINTAAEQAFIFAQTSTLTSVLAPYHIGAIDTGSGYKWRDTTSLSYPNWAALNPSGTAPRCADIGTLGTWTTGKCSSTGAVAADNTYYVCEDDTPTVAPNEDAATAYVIPQASTRVVTGSTRRMNSDYNGATLLPACGGTSGGGDAVFKITTDASTSYTLGVDSAGSSFSAVLGLFENTIDASGYKACDAFGGSALTYTLLPSRTYYIVVKGTALSTEGNYKLKFTNLTTPAPNGTQLSCVAGSSTVPKPSVDVDVDANHTYYVVVDQASALFGKYTLEAQSLYLHMSEVDNQASANETGNSALSLPDPYRSRVNVVDTSTAGMTADYGNGSTGMCTTSASAPDAVYKFTPSLSTSVTFTVKPNGAGINNVGIGIYDGLPGTSAVQTDLNASGNPNEAGPSAQAVPMTGPAQLYTGNTSSMSADVDPSLLACGSMPKGHDAVFSFHLDKSTNVELDASGSTVTDPVINLFKANMLSKPAQTTLENDAYTDADAHPSPTPNVNSAVWLYYGADFNHLTSMSQTSVSLAAVNDDSPPGTKQPQDLGDVANGMRYVISGGNTSPMIADYPGKWSCGASDSAPDAIYKLYSSTGGQVHIKATPASGYNAVIGLFDGSNGAPLRLADVSSLVEDTACVPMGGPKNLTNATLKTINAALGTAPNLVFNCGASILYTDDPDGSGGLDVSLTNGCGVVPKTIVQSQPNGPDVVVIATNSMQIAAGSSLRVLGTRPVVFVVKGTATINGVLTVSPDSVGNPFLAGAGGDFGCGTSLGGNGQSSGTTSGGGGGGGFRTAGGLGGQGASGSVPGGPAGVARSATTLVPLIGGCSGGDAGFASSGGKAAGAVQISATTSIVFGASGSIAADGGNGTVGASGQNGGSGAASGGGISLQSPSITYMASQLSAKGGTGGGGLGSPASSGGTGSTLAANPGNAGQDGAAAAGGGGGGGGYGVVVVDTGALSLTACTTATNENASSAWTINLDTSSHEFIERGNTSTMTSDYGNGLWGPAFAAPDAVYGFTLTKTTNVSIDGTASFAGSPNTVIGLFDKTKLVAPATPVLLENDDQIAADANPAPTPDVANQWIAYTGDLMHLGPNAQPQTTIDNSSNKNEIIPTELGDPIDRRITVSGANTSMMAADYLAASCNMPAADMAPDALYRFVPAKDGLVRVSTNYSDTTFSTVLSIYKGTRNVTDERVLLQNTAQGILANRYVDSSTIKVFNLARTKQYSGTTDYSVLVKDEKSIGLVRTGASTIGNPETVSVDYTYDSGAPLPISQQQTTTVDLGAAGNKNENADTATWVPIQSGNAYQYTGDTTNMSSDVSESLFKCGPPQAGSRDATFDFSLDKSTTVSISTAGSSFNTTVALFSEPYTKPSVTSLIAPAPVLTQLYDVRQVPGVPEYSCSFFDSNGERYFLCETARPWSQAEAMCQAVGLHLATLDNQAESDAVLAKIQPLALDHHIGFTEAVPYTDSWGVWTSGGGDTSGAAVGGLYVNWQAGEPNGSGDCLEMLFTGTWDDANCATTKPYICESPTAAATSAPTGSTCGSMVTYNSHNYYACTDLIDWTTAKARCTSAGMALAHVNDSGENAQLKTWAAGKSTWLGGSDSAVEGQWVWADNSAGFWSLSGSAFRNWAAGEPNQKTTNPGARMHSSDGKWEDTPYNTGNFPYVCENPVVPTGLPTPPTTSSPKVVDVFSAQRQFRGSTESTPNSVGSFIGCGADGSAPDAVFAITLKYTTTLGVDITGSFANSVVGLFKDDISSLGYSSGGSRCVLGSAMSPQLTGTFSPGQYYVVITGTSPTASGVYNVRFDATTTDAAAFTMKNDTLTDAHNNPLGSVDGKWLVKKADMSGLKPSVSQSTLDMSSNDNDVTAHSLGSIQNTQLIVNNASTNGFAADYPAGTLCSTTAAGPDAVYSFTPVDSDPLQFRFAPSSWNGQIVLYDGPPVTSALLPPAATDLGPTYTNETRATAKTMNAIGVQQSFLGNLTMMGNDVPSVAFNPSALAGGSACNASSTGNDAFFTFTLTGSKQVEISSKSTAIAHTIALWDSKLFAKPAATAVQYDDRTTATMAANLLGGADIDDDWVVVSGNTTTLTPYLPVTKKTEGSDFLHNDTVHSLGDVKGKQLVTASTTTTGLAADYPVQCSGSSVTAPDAAFSFTHSTGGAVRVALNNPNPFVPTTMALYLGTANTIANLTPTSTSVGTANESATAGVAYAAAAPGVPANYTGTNAAMVNNYPGSVFTQGSAYTPTHTCNPDAAGKDAFITFTTPGTKGVSPNVNVQISSQSATFNQTIALWDTTPISAPSPVTMSNDKRHDAFVAPIGTIDDDWVVKSATMSSLMPGALTASSPAVAANDDVQELGDPVGKRINVAGATNVGTVLSDFPAATLGCAGTNDAPADMIYHIKPTSNTTIRAAVNNPTAPLVTTSVAIINGTKPKRFVDTSPAAATTNYCTSGFNYTPSNFTLGSSAGQVSFTTAPSVTLNCSQTLTFDSSTSTWSGFCGQTQPTPVVVSQSGAPDLVVLPFKSLTIASGMTINMTGSRGVVFAVESNVSISGTVSASASGTTAGAGGNYSCSTGSAAGENGASVFLAGTSSAGGGGYGTKGGNGTAGDLLGVNPGGTGGSARGNATLVPLLSGCYGGNSAGSCNLAGGAGGGAIQISAGGTVTLGATGIIKANGGDAPHGNCGFLNATSSEGGGGGSGGAVLLEGASVVTTAGYVISANGGGGDGSGGGGSTSSASSGANGSSGGGGGGGYGRTYTRVVPCTVPNDTTGSATTVPIGLTQTFTSVTTGLASNLAGTSPNWGTCAPDAAGPDAFYKFTLTRSTNVEANATGTGYNHTVTIFNNSMVAQSCADGTSASPGITSATLPAGTYYVGFKTRNGGVGGTYTLAIRDTAAGGTYSSSVACSTTGYVDAALTANTDYDIIVKGATANGTYNLTVTDIGAVTNFGCGTDLSAPDAYFDFTLGATRDIFISLNEVSGKLDGSFQLYKDVGADDNTSNDTPQGACAASSATYSGLTAGRYYVLVRGVAVANSAGIAPAEITIKDASGANALDCADIASGATGSITRSLAAGTTYYAGITTRGGSAGGTYTLQLSDTSATVGTGATLVGCSDSNGNIDYTIPVGDANKLHTVVLKGATGTNAGTYTMSVTDVSSVQDLCAVGDSLQSDPTAPDAYYGFKLTNAGRSVTVSLDSTSALDGVYRLFKSDLTPVGSCHDRSAPFTYTGLAAGTYYVALRGKSSASGAANASYQLSIQDQSAYGSLACSDGVASNGTTITKNLNAGTYYVGIKPQSGQTDPKSYKLAFRDATVAVASAPNEKMCAPAGTVASPSLTPGNTYYVVVKGNTASDKGSYGLTVTDLGASGDFGCNSDPGAGDAYFEFNVDGPSDKLVTIDTEGSTLDTVLGLFPSGATINAANLLQCNDDGGATAGSSKITRMLSPGVYYAVVRSSLAAANQSAAFQLSVRDENAYGSIACGVTSGGVKAQVQATLGPGTYHAVLKGMAATDKGPYSIRFRDEGPFLNAGTQDACNDGQNELQYTVTAGKPYYVLVKGKAANQSGPYRLTVENQVARTGMGCNAGNLAPDAVYRFHLSAPTKVQIDTLGSQTSAMSPVPTDTVIALYDGTATSFGTNYAKDKNNNTVSCDDDSGNAAKGWSKIVADLPGNADYYVVVKSKSSVWGSAVGATLPFIVNIRDVNSNQPIAYEDANSSQPIKKSLAAGDYYVVVSNSSGSSGGGPFDVHFKNMDAAAAKEVACADTPEEFTSTLVANRPYYLIVKGDAPTGMTTDRGQYGLLVETSGSSTGMGCGANPASADGFFKFQLASQSWVNIDTDSSSPATTTDTVIALYPGNATSFGSNYALDVSGQPVDCDDDSGSTAGSSRIRAQLNPGTYYVVVKGKNSGWTPTTTQFNLSIRDETNTTAIACADNTLNKKLTQTLPAGDYNVVFGTTSASGGVYSLKFRDTALNPASTASKVACGPGPTLASVPLQGGKTYYAVVKGDSATDSGGYTFTMEDTNSLAAASGSTSIACGFDGTPIDGTYPAGTYYALVTGKNASDSGPYTLKVRDVDALNDNNRLACDDNSGPNQTSVIESDLTAGTYYVVVKGDGATAKGSYNLNIRDKNGVPDNELLCGGATQSERLTYNVQAGQDYTVLLKGASTGSSGNYDIKMYDQTGLQAGAGTILKCLGDPQPTPLYNTNWHTKAVDYDLNLTPDTYYVAVKGTTSTAKGTFQLNIGDKTARTSTTYTPPTWTQLKDALATSAARVLPVIATGGDTSGWAPAAEAQAKVIATISQAVGKNGTPIWQKIQNDGRGTGSGLITGIAQMAEYLALDVSLVPVDGPDPGASKFRIDIAPGNSSSCTNPHPLVDPATGACTPQPGNPAGYSCNTQYACVPGAAPKFTVTFTNPTDSPVPPNPTDVYGGYHFKLQLIGNKQYLLDEIPVYIIPTTHMAMGAPGPGAGTLSASGTYMQDITTATCPAIAGGTSVTNDLPQWADLYYKATVPDGTSMDFELCTKTKQSDLANCVWSDGTAATRKKVTVRAKGACVNNADCRGVSGYGNGTCKLAVCQFITQPKVAYDLNCVDDTPCPNGPLGAGDFIIASHCETTKPALGYGHCVYDSQPVDLGATLLTGEQGLPYARVRITMHSDSLAALAPTLFQWNLTYNCKTAQ